MIIPDTFSGGFMKTLPILLLLVFSNVYAQSASSKNAVKKTTKFNQINSQMRQNIEEVISQNPQIYEKQLPSRMPASVPSSSSDITEKLDHVEEQADGNDNW